jgi:hypothetical protein
MYVIQGNPSAVAGRWFRVEYHHRSRGSSGRTVQMAGFDVERRDELWLNR